MLWERNINTDDGKELWRKLQGDRIYREVRENFFWIKQHLGWHLKEEESWDNTLCVWGTACGSELLDPKVGVWAKSCAWGLTGYKDLVIHAP